MAKRTGVTSIQPAREAADRMPCRQSSKLNVPLDPKEPADEAVKRIGLHLLLVMESNVSGVCVGEDTEFLHDFRIAVRRTRSLLGQFKPLFPSGILDRFRNEFRWLNKATNAKRDLDVYLENFENGGSWLPAGFRTDLAPLREFLIVEQQHAQASLVNVLTGSRYGRVVRGWRRYLESPAADPPTSPAAGRPIEEIASRRIWKAYRCVVREGRAILHDPEAPAEAMHRLRISCKRLRYLLEMFAGLYPTGTIKGIVKALKRLQDNLGAFQDFQVEQQKLRLFAGKMLQNGMAHPETILAMGRLQVHLEGLQRDAKDAFAGHFKKFAHPGVRKKFERLFRE